MIPLNFNTFLSAILQHFCEEEKKQEEFIVASKFKNFLISFQIQLFAF